MQCLVDSGSEVSICTAKMLEQFNIPRKCISKNCGSMNIVTSNSISTNYILGTIHVDVFLLLQDKDNNVFGKSKNVKFYVANDSVILKSPILGNIFDYQNQVTIDYSQAENCIITASLISENNTLERTQLQVSSNNTDLKLVNKTEIKQNVEEKYIFQSKQIFYGQLEGFFKEHLEFSLPQGQFSISNTPKVNFEKINSKMRQKLFSKDCVPSSYLVFYCHI